ncbi:Lar family restriction alleviation protein [Pseudomonas aeruginosa]|nr:Lar family restriction alleviation protein [Pseudomonas aeruginosa]MCS8762529.1 Lar family restriction alleviation protein [Pseudomonas aeruginosa]MCS8929574.1 Lar family restriction alleviation protein [Pseudomonas aeruginosa]
MTNANECTCPSGDGSLAHPCPAHPASVKQTGGDERDLQAEGAQGELLPCPFCGGQAHLTYDDYVHDDLRPMPVVECNACHTWVRAESWNKRAALAQPSPAQAEGAPVVGCLCGMPMTEGHHSQDGCCNLEEFAPQAQAEQAEAERPEVVAWRYGSSGGIVSDKACLDEWKSGGEYQSLMTVAQHDRIVGELRTEIAMLRSYESEWELLLNEHEQLRDAAQARVAELTATRNRYGLDAHYFNKNLQRILRDFESFTPDELARSLIILAKVADEKVVAQAQHSVPEGWKLVPIEPTQAQLSAGQTAWLADPMRRSTTLYRAMLAAAPQPVAEGE